MGGWSGRAKGHAYRTPPSEWYGLLGGKKAVPGGQLQPDPASQDEITRLKALEAWYRDANGTEDTARARTGVVESRPLAPKARSLGQVEVGQFFDATVKIMHVHVRDMGRSGAHMPKYELYVADGTVNPHPTHNFHNIDAGIPPGALMCLTVFASVSAASESLFKPGATLHFKNVNVNRYRGQGDLELKWSDLVSNQQVAEGWKDRKCYLVGPDMPEVIEIEQ